MTRLRVLPPKRFRRLAAGRIWSRPMRGPVRPLVRCVPQAGLARRGGSHLGRSRLRLGRGVQVLASQAVLLSRWARPDRRSPGWPSRAFSCGLAEILLGCHDESLKQPRVDGKPPERRRRVRQGRGARKKKPPPGARNPLKRLISDERIQGIPRKSNPPKPGNSRSPGVCLRRPEEIQISAMTAAVASIRNYLL